MTTRRRPRWSELQEVLRPARVPLHATDRRLARAASIADLRRLARRRAPRAVFDYTDGAAGEELSLSRSREAYSRVEFSPRVLQDVSGVDTSTTILGKPSAAPWAFAPTGFTRMMHTEGESAVGRVAALMGVPYALSTMGTTSIEQPPLPLPTRVDGSSSTSGVTARPAATSSCGRRPRATRRPEQSRCVATRRRGLPGSQESMRRRDAR